MIIKVYAMSLNRKTAVANLNSVSLPLVEHLLKIYMFPNSGHRTHWSKEVWTFFHDVPKLKSNNKLLSYKIARDAISAYEDRIDHSLRVIAKEYPDLEVERFNEDEASNMVAEYLDWICDLACKGEDISSYDVMDKLEEIGF